MALTADTSGAIPSPVPIVFVDASVLIPAAISSRGTSRDLINAGQRGAVHLFVSEDILDEAERNLKRKAPHALATFIGHRNQLARAQPTAAQIADAARHIEPKDVPVVAGAIAAGAQYLVTFDRRHLLGEALLIRREYRIEVVTPDYIIALLPDS